MLHELLAISLQEKRVVSLCGGGGKTTLMYALAREAKKNGKTALFTTTNIFVPDEPDIHVLNPFGAEETLALWQRGEIVAAGVPVVGVNKLAAPEPDAQAWLLTNSDGLYVEADGSKRLPLKYPAQWEPVLPEQTTHTVVVAGLSALGKKRKEIVHRADLAEEQIGYREPIVSEEGMAKLLWDGYGKYDPVFCLNQADNAETEERGGRVAEKLLSLGARRVVVLSLKNILAE